jgi:hypothetical protein
MLRRGAMRSLPHAELAANPPKYGNFDNCVLSSDAGADELA